MSFRYVITHPDMGIYLGNCMGLGFWSKLDAAGQDRAVTFASIDAAAQHVRSWECPIGAVVYVPIQCGNYATISDLVAAGLKDDLGDLAFSRTAGNA